MMPFRFRSVAAVLSIVLISVASTPLISAAQATPVSTSLAASDHSGAASICVLAFADVNKNGVREASEGLLTGANLGLLIPNTSGTGGTLIANDVTDAQGQSCFNNLTPGTYLLTFNDPLALPTTLTSEKVTVAAGQQITRDFGALPMQGTLQDVNSDKVTILLTRRNRVIVSLLAAAVAMIVMIGLGLVIYNSLRLIWGRPRPEPEEIT